ncbi:MAG: hypothetical protein WDW36_000924 [Sanguina aurantia]
MSSTITCSLTLCACTETDLEHLRAAAQLAGSSAGLSQPHPNAACVLVGANGRPLSRTFQFAQGTISAEEQAVAVANGSAAGSTAYLNLESGNCHGDASPLSALIEAGVSRVVVGLRHPLQHLRGGAVQLLRSRGVTVDVLGEAQADCDEEDEQVSLAACLAANEPLLHRAVLHRPLSILKYAMTLDGKIATSTGHSAWVSSAESRACVFAMRARSDAVIVGGNTVRRDDPRLTTRQEGGHTPVRVVMSRCLDLPESAHLWDVGIAPTIVMTQRGGAQELPGACESQGAGGAAALGAVLRDRGVEVVEFDFLTPALVADYCQQRGFLQCFWECGGTLAAPAISSGVIHRIMAFVAPKIIGGERAPSPVGELGFVEMTQAVNLIDSTWQQVGSDLLLTGYMPSSGGLFHLASKLSESAAAAASGGGLSSSSISTDLATAGSLANGAGLRDSSNIANFSSMDDNPHRDGSLTGALEPDVDAGITADSAGGSSSSIPIPSAAQQLRTHNATAVVGAAAVVDASHTAAAAAAGLRRRGATAAAMQPPPVVSFYKPWDRWGALSNFSPHPVELALLEDSVGEGGTSDCHHQQQQWTSVEHFYQASKFAGTSNPAALPIIEAIHNAHSPESAARIGRTAERSHPHLLRHNWSSEKLNVMHRALTAKFSCHAGPRAMLLSTAAPAPSRLSQYAAAAAAGNGCSQPSDTHPTSSMDAEHDAAAAAAAEEVPPYAGYFVKVAGGGDGRQESSSSSFGGGISFPGGAMLVEGSPNDYFWGCGYHGSGTNHLGRLLMRVRDELHEAGDEVQPQAE